MLYVGIFSLHSAHVVFLFLRGFSFYLSHVEKQAFVGLCCGEEQTEAGDVCRRHPEMNPAVREQRLMLLPLPANLL